MTPWIAGRPLTNPIDAPAMTTNKPDAKQAELLRRVRDQGGEVEQVRDRDHADRGSDPT